MKKLICLVSLVFVCFSFCSCGKSEENNARELTEKDYKNIDMVYDAMAHWDKIQYDSGEKFYINKISFQDFDETNKIAFYKNYPIAGYCGVGYYITNEGLKGINPDVYDSDATIIHKGCLMQTALHGTVWDYTATDEEKYEIIKSAYISFLETSVYANK